MVLDTYGHYETSKVTWVHLRWVAKFAWWPAWGTHSISCLVQKNTFCTKWWLMASCSTLTVLSKFGLNIHTIHCVLLTGSGHWQMKSVVPGAGPWFNIKMTFYQHRKSHCGDKTILRPSYLHNGISYTGKTTSLYWIGAQVSRTETSNYILRYLWLVISYPCPWNLGSDSI